MLLAATSPRPTRTSALHLPCGGKCRTPTSASYHIVAICYVVHEYQVPLTFRSLARYKIRLTRNNNNLTRLKKSSPGLLGVQWPLRLRQQKSPRRTQEACPARPRLANLFSILP